MRDALKITQEIQFTALSWVLYTGRWRYGPMQERYVSREHATGMRARDMPCGSCEWPRSTVPTATAKRGLYCPLFLHTNSVSRYKPKVAADNADYAHAEDFETLHLLSSLCLSQPFSVTQQCSVTRVLPIKSLTDLTIHIRSKPAQL